MVAATVLTCLFIVPATQVMRRSQAMGRELELRQELSTRCASLLEQEIAALDRRFRRVDRRRTLNYERQRLRYVVQSTDAASAGGIPGRVMCVSVMIWHDENRNGTLDTTERSAVLVTRHVNSTIRELVTSFDREATRTSPLIARSGVTPC